MSAVFALLIIDYLITYLGIQIGIITEANPLMRWLFELPIEKGLPIRAAMSLIVILPLWYLKKHYKYYRRVIAFILAIYAVVMGMHYLWIKRL